MKTLIETNTEKLNHLLKAVYTPETPQEAQKFQMIAAAKFMGTFEEFINSEELENVHAGFQSKTFHKKENFICAIVTEDGKMWVKYKADGLTFFRRETIGLSICNGGFADVVQWGEIGFIIDRRTYYKNCETNREIWRKQDWKILSK